MAQWGLFGGVAIGGALLLVLTLPFVLPRARRRLVRGPAGFLLLHLVFLALRGQAAADSTAHAAAEALAIFTLLASIGRSGFLLTVYGMVLRLDQPPPKIFLDILMGLIYAAVFLITLGAVGVRPIELITGSAVITAIVGLALKDTLGNMVAGLAIHAQRPFDLGDWIQFDDRLDHIGKVIEINWRATKLLTTDAVEVIIPNGKLADSAIRNFTQPQPWSRRSVYVTCADNVPPRQVQTVILDAIRESWGMVDDPAPSVLVNGFTERGIEYWVRFFTEHFDQRDRVDSGVRERIWYALHRAGLAISPPQRQLRWQEDLAAARMHSEEEQLRVRKQSLRGVDLFAALSEETLERLARRCRTRLFAEQETIIRQGDPGDELFIIERGAVAVTAHRDGASEQEVAQLGPGQCFGEMALLTGEQRRATVRALGECELLAVGKPALAPLLADAPELAEQMSRLIAARHDELRERLTPAADQRQLVDQRSEKLLRSVRQFFGL